MTNELNKWKDENLNSISSSFCAAKWYNASIHLGHGYTGSCHLPLPHPIDITQVTTNPSALHNTDHKKKLRKMMLTGVRPAECSYCWKVEDLNNDLVSDRVFKSQIYSIADISAIKDMEWDADVSLKTLEISFDRQCNFGCSYCNAAYSSTWADDLANNGAYQNFVSDESGAGAYQSDGQWAVANGKKLDNNPYVDAFLKWWPELSKTLFELRVTGGEPTVSQNFWRFIDLLKNDESLPNLRFAINSNLGMGEIGLRKLITLINTMPVKEFDLYTSNESFGKHAEYIRDGLNYDLWKSNLVEILTKSKVRNVTVMMTINNLCLMSITEFLDDMMTLKTKYHNLAVDLNILRWPGFMSPVMLPEDVKLSCANKLSEWLIANDTRYNIGQGEKMQIQRVIDYLLKIESTEVGHLNSTENRDKMNHDFKSFFTQYDLRRGKNFIETFPMLAQWFNDITLRKEYQIIPIRSAGITHYDDREYK